MPPELVEDILHHSGVGHWVWYLNDTFWWSARAQAILGCAPASIAELLALLHPGDRERFAANQRRKLTTGDAPAQPFRLLSEQGITYLQTESHVVHDADGQPLRIFGTVRVSTPEESARFDDSVLLARLMDIVPGSINVIDHTQDNVVYQNGFGRFSLQELIASGFYHPDEVDAVRAYFDKLDTAPLGTIHEMDYRYRVGRQWRWAFSRATAIEGRRSLGFVVDITERQARMAALARFQRALRASEQQGKFGSWSLSEGDTWLSEGLLQILGLSPDAPQDLLRLRRYVHPDDRLKVLRAFRPREGVSKLEVSFRLVRPDGQLRQLWASGQVGYGEDGTINQHHGVVADLTEHQQAARLEVLGLLASGIAHDFNNMLTVISNSVFLIRKAQDAAERDAELAVLEGASQRAAALVRQLLAYSRQEAIVPLPCSINRVVSDTAEMMRGSLGDYKLRVCLAEALPAATVDGSRLGHSLCNLLVNARDAMPGGGELHIRTALSALSTPLAGPVETIPPGRYAVVSVADGSVGISAEDLHNVFKPFFSTKGRRGTGLGLASVWDFVKQSDGYIAVDTAPGQGCRIALYFPVS